MQQQMKMTVGQMMKELAQRRAEDEIEETLAEIGARIYASLDFSTITYTTASELAKLYLREPCNSK